MSLVWPKAEYGLLCLILKSSGCYFEILFSLFLVWSLGCFQADRESRRIKFSFMHQISCPQICGPLGAIIQGRSALETLKQHSCTSEDATTLRRGGSYVFLLTWHCPHWWLGQNNCVAVGCGFFPTLSDGVILKAVYREDLASDQSSRCSICACLHYTTFSWHSCPLNLPSTCNEIKQFKNKANTTVNLFQPFPLAAQLVSRLCKPAPLV